MPTARKPRTVSIIGSFRKFYPEVLESIRLFEKCDLRVLSPQKSYIVNTSEEFVRFESDPPGFADAEIQLEALRGILGSDFVFVVSPKGYIGRTTCYEIGRIHERAIPLFFSEVPLDLPIFVPSSTVMSAMEVVDFIAETNRLPHIGDNPGQIVTPD